jgi:hypothetical protein
VLPLLNLVIDQIESFQTNRVIWTLVRNLQYVHSEDRTVSLTLKHSSAMGAM